MKQNIQPNKKEQNQLEDKKLSYKIQENKRKRRERKKFFKKVKTFFEEIWMYVFTMAGVLLSKYMPQIKEVISTGSDKNINFNIPYKAEIIAAFVMALLVVYMMDKGGSEEGKKRNFKRRALTYFANGVMWHTILGG